MEYLLITATGAKGIADSAPLNDQVNKKLNDTSNQGFKPLGSPGITIDPKTGTALYYQALIKE